MFLASLEFAVINIFIKYLDHIPFSELVLFRSVIMFLFTLAFMMYLKVGPSGKNTSKLLLRGLLGTVGIMAYFYTVQNMPLASAVVVHYVTPIVTSFLAVFILKEKLVKNQWMFFVICLIGIAIISGFDPEVEAIEVVVGLIGTLAAGSAYNIVRMLRNVEHHFTIMIAFPVVTIPLVLIYMFLFDDWVNPEGWDWLHLFMIGGVTALAQYHLTLSYKMEKANVVSIISYMGIIYGIIVGYFLFNETYSWEAAGGIALVVVGIILNLVFTRKAKT